MRSNTFAKLKQNPLFLLIIVILTIIALVGAWTRWRYMQASVFQIDEFISMLAIRMILEKGKPILPSGLYYDHGLVFSYIGALIAYAAGDNLLAVRWWSLIAGVVAVVALWVTAWRLYDSPWWGLIPALYLALDPNAIQWGGRIRMYSQADLIVIFWVLLAWLGTLDGERRWARWLLIALIWVGLNTHLVLLLLLPPLAFALLVTWLVRHRRFSLNQKTAPVADLASPTHSTLKIQPDVPDPHQLILQLQKGLSLSRELMIDLFLAIAVIAVAFWSGQQSFVASYTVDSSVPDTDTEAINPDPVNDVISFELSDTRWLALEHYLDNGVLRRYSVLALLGLAAIGVALVRGRLERADLGGLFISLMTLSLMLGMLLFVADTWHQVRYYFLLIFPLILLLSAYGIRAMFNSTLWLTRRLALGGTNTANVAGIAAVLLVGVLWPLPSLWSGAGQAMSGSTNTPNRYPSAFEVVNASRAPGDQIATIRPEAAYLFSGSLDYYVNHSSPVLIPGEGGWYDGYTGAPYLDNVRALRQALARPGTLWLVIDDERLYNHLEPIFAQYILAHLDLVETIDNVLVLQEGTYDDPPYPAETTPPLATLASNIQLVDYTIDAAAGPGQPARLTTFWQNTRTLWLFKIFVHLRDQTGATLAQADFAPLEQIDEHLREAMVGRSSSDIIPLTTSLTLPPELPPGEYRLYIGVYHPVALERVPVIDDQSGENA
ncbi:MAG: glycosyltransferase family 39 protein, partial [Anaerolineae bacterium]|nr:glycosyltransferase family 39 protein [Anaerolineae bacterium]